MILFSGFSFCPLFAFCRKGSFSPDTVRAGAKYSMLYLQTVVRSLISLVVLFVFTKLIGKRQIANMSLFDYINGMTIGSIAGELATGIERNIWVGVISMSFYGVAVFLIDIINRKSVRARRFLSGTPTLLFQNGTFLKKNFAKAQISVSEFQEMCRIAGYYDISDIASAQLESNGRMSVLAKSESQKVTLADLNITPQKQATPPVSVIYDGKILDRNLIQLGKNPSWLMNQLKAQKVALADVFLGMVDGEGNLSNYLAKN